MVVDAFWRTKVLMGCDKQFVEVARDARNKGQPLPEIPGRCGPITMHG